jgi:hypothetical protein
MLSGTCDSYKGIECKNLLRVRAFITRLLKNLENSKAQYFERKILIFITIKNLGIRGK